MAEELLQATKKSVGLACQGGGITSGSVAAGVMRGLVEYGAFDTFDINAFSGTSGGALVATVCWGHKLRALKGNDPKIIGEIPDVLEKQWMAMAYGTLPTEEAAEGAFLFDSLARLNPFYDWTAQNVRVPWLRSIMKEWIQRYVEVDKLVELRDAMTAEGKAIPHLALGAAEVLRGEARVFEAQDLCLDTLCASGSLDEMNGITIIQTGPNKGIYVDGAWGTNPPLDAHIEFGVDEIWLVENFPKTRAEIPNSLAERKDRKDELWQNSLVEHEIKMINFVNKNLNVLNQNRAGNPYRHITIRRLPMLLDIGSVGIAVNSRAFIKKMMDYGYSIACDFMINRNAELQAATP